MAAYRSTTNDHVRSFLTMRRVVGMVGILLPLVLVAGHRLSGGGTVHSISRYYHTEMRDLFVGGLCAMALFLFCAGGRRRSERTAIQIAAMCALGVAFFPVAAVGEAVGAVAIAHYLFAFTLFVTLGACSICFFGKNRDTSSESSASLRWVHIACGVVIFVNVALIVWHSAFVDCDKSQCEFVFWAETVALTAFGCSWLLEGRDIEVAATKPWRPVEQAA